MDAIQFLKKEHQKAKAALAKVLEASAQDRGRLWNELRPELEAHEQMEDTCLYGPLSQDAGTKDKKLAEWRQHHQSEVKKVEGVIGEIGKLAPSDARWESKVKEVQSSLEHHIHEEEGEIFPRISQAWKLG